MTPLSARSSSPREGAGSPRIKVAAARFISDRGGEPGGLPVVSTLPAAESTVHTAAGTAAPFTLPPGGSRLPGATWTTPTPRPHFRRSSVGRPILFGHAAGPLP